MRKVYWEILASVVVVLGGTYVAYTKLEGYEAFWDAQVLWSIALSIGWAAIAASYYREGWLAHHSRSQTTVSPLIPLVVFLVQCFLFVKGIFFHDWSLIGGSLVVNSGVVFYLYQIMVARRRRYR